MGLGKIIAIIFVILILIIGVIGVDIYLTVSTLSDTDLSTAVSDPTFEISDDNSTVTISIEVSLPSAGFIPKGVILDLIVDFAGNEQVATENIELGETKTLNLSYTMTETNIQTLSSGGSILVMLSAIVTPTVFGFAVNQAEQTIDLGSQTISA